jgi:hypothetical protein
MEALLEPTAGPRAGGGRGSGACGRGGAVKRREEIRFDVAFVIVAGIGVSFPAVIVGRRVFVPETIE